MPKYYLPPQITTEGVLRSGRLEVLLPQVIFDAGDLPFCVDTGPGQLQRVLVEIGRIDLHPVDEGLGSQ